MSQQQKSKVFVLDTCVYLHDPNALFSFKEHDIYVPMAVLRELDNQKSNFKRPENARNARQISRYFDELLIGATPKDVEKGFSLSSLFSHYGKSGPSEKIGRVFFEMSSARSLVTLSYNDGVIINYTSELKKSLGESTEVIFVTQDINARITALVCGIQTEEYQSGKALDDIDLLYSGMFQLPPDFWDIITVENAEKKGEISRWEITTPLTQKWYPNQFLYLVNENGETEEYIVRNINDNSAEISTIIDYRKDKRSIWGIHPLNKEQNFFINALMDPKIHFVSGAGKAGSGKTLLALAAALEQVVETKIYNEILVTKEAMPIGEDIGFFPGTEEQKMMPWMMAFTDNLDFLTSGIDTVHKQTANDLMKRFIKMRAIGPMQGRTFHKKIVIVDETQNLTSKQMLDLVTRAGPGTKFVCLGNIKQIATPYLTGEASGLTHVVEAFKPWKGSAHVTLVAGERSPLAEFAADNLCQ